jgi:hypothetical protein
MIRSWPPMTKYPPHSVSWGQFNKPFRPNLS